MYKVYSAFIMFVGVALTAASNQAFGGSGAAHGGIAASTHPTTFRPSLVRFPNRHFGRDRGNLFPAVGGVYWGPTDGQPYAEGTPPITRPMSGEINHTFDIPWDWAHRYPPGFFGSPFATSAPPVAYSPGCATQTVTVPGADGKDQIINVVRC